ncbi:DUF4364 domain-containing protein [Candidatus Bathyarchaeota archaeon]|nr:MAG: DUF4364 domain-containing protein [Candidatus Bathyarchaeota archaeon]
MRKTDNKRGHRDSLDIVADILKASLGGAKKTQLMYHCNLSFRQLESYLSLLLEKNLLKRRIVEKSRPSILFEITEKGQEFLRNYKILKSLIST